MHGAKKKAIKLLQKKDHNAAGILLYSIDTKTPEGKATFRMIQIYHDKDSGYAGGQFAKEWATLTKRFEEIQMKDIKEVKKEYYAPEVKLNEHPTLFINALDENCCRPASTPYR